MSAKRSATTDLNHDNWNEEHEPEEVGTFAKASNDILEKRVFKTARRRLPQSNDVSIYYIFFELLNISRTLIYTYTYVYLIFQLYYQI